MSQQQASPAEPCDVAAIMGGLYGDGIIGCQRAFPRPFIEQLGQEIGVLFAQARSLPGGALERGPHRYYVEIHPERLSGFAAIASHPWVEAVCRAVLGPQYQIVEAGFDVPEPGAMRQPWHRDFASPPATLVGRRLDSLAFNITTVDVRDDMGPLEIAPGTQWDDWAGDPMFPPPPAWERYEQRRQRKLPRMGDISARSALTIHRGTANLSHQARPVFVLGVDAPDARNAERHDLQLSARYAEALPASLRSHVRCRIVDTLQPLVQAHTIQGLLMSAKG